MNKRDPIVPLPPPIRENAIATRKKKNRWASNASLRGYICVKTKLAKKRLLMLMK